MPDSAHWAVFLAAAFVLLITPGPSIMYVVARGVTEGDQAAMLSSLGLALGDEIQVIAAAFGISAAFDSAPKLLVGLKFAGAGYLVLLGIRTLLRKGLRTVEKPTEATPSQTSSRALILQGLLALNPKTGLFLLAFLPQFVMPGRGPIAIQMLALGSVFAIIGMITNSLFGCMGARLGVLTLKNPRLQGATRYVSGAILIVLGIMAALATGEVHTLAVRTGTL